MDLNEEQATLLAAMHSLTINSGRDASNTGGEGGFTQWVWVELIESTETIRLANTHQVHAEFI